MNSELKEIFGDCLYVKSKPIPVAHLKYDGPEKTYIVWSIVDTELFYADDVPAAKLCTVDIDIYSDKNYKDVVTEIIKIMQENDWIWTDESPEMYETDTGLYHLCISFQKEGAI